jgi:hypothetical protein
MTPLDMLRQVVAKYRAKGHQVVTYEERPDGMGMAVCFEIFDKQKGVVFQAVQTREDFLEVRTIGMTLEDWDKMVAMVAEMRQ